MREDKSGCNMPFILERKEKMIGKLVILLVYKMACKLYNSNWENNYPQKISLHFFPRDAQKELSIIKGSGRTARFRMRCPPFDDVFAPLDSSWTVRRLRFSLFDPVTCSSSFSCSSLAISPWNWFVTGKSTDVLFPLVAQKGSWTATSSISSFPRRTLH